MMNEPSLKEGARVRILKQMSHAAENTSIFDGYNVKGVLIQDVEIGRDLVMWRTERNGIKVPGVFTTSYVHEIERIGNDAWKVKTENSTFLVEWEGVGCE